MFYEGTIGNRPVGFRFVIEKQRPKTATYYFAPDWRERSLAVVRQEPGTLILRSDDGSVFDLRFFYDEHTAAEDFYDSIGLRGTMDGAPVKITGNWSREFDVGGPLYSETGAKSDEAFERNVRGFIDAVLADRPSDAARFTSFPLRSDFCRREIRNLAELRRDWSWLFPNEFKAELSKSVLHGLPIDSHSDEAFLLRGDIYFDESGATLVRPPKCPPRPPRKSTGR